jgi:hypothetical protein
MAIAGVSSAEAHPAYEGAPRLLKTSSGEIEVVKSYIDGIVAADPAKIVVRSRGAVLAETKYFRDISLACSSTRCLIVAADSPFALIPEHTWVLEHSSLRSADSFGARLVGTSVHLRNHKLGYALAVFFAVVPVAAIRQRTLVRRRQTSAAGCFTALVLLGACAVLLVWLYVLVLLSELWLAWALLLVAVLWFGGRSVAEGWANKRFAAVGGREP